MNIKKFLSKLRFLKKKRAIFSILIIIFFSLIHSCMNFRTSDKETREYFEEAGVTSTIDHVEISLSKSTVRVISTGDQKKPYRTLCSWRSGIRRCVLQLS